MVFLLWRPSLVVGTPVPLADASIPASCRASVAFARFGGLQRLALGDAGDLAVEPTLLMQRCNARRLWPDRRRKVLGNARGQAREHGQRNQHRRHETA
jgi:hypothetical protein